MFNNNDVSASGFEEDQTEIISSKEISLRLSSYLVNDVLSTMVMYWGYI